TDPDTDPAGDVFAGRELRAGVGASHEKAVREAFVPAFERQTGAKVTLHAAADAVQKLKDAKGKDPPFDLILTDAVQGHPAAREGLFAKIDLTNVPNHKALAPAALDNWVFKEGHGITCPGAALVLAYDPKLAGGPPKTWSDLQRKDVGGQVGLPRSFVVSL